MAWREAAAAASRSLLHTLFGALGGGFGCDLSTVLAFAREALFEAIGLGTVDVVDFGSGLVYAVCERVLRVVVRVTGGILVSRTVRFLITGAGKKEQGGSQQQGGWWWSRSKSD